MLLLHHRVKYLSPGSSSADTAWCAIRSHLPLGLRDIMVVLSCIQYLFWSQTTRYCFFRLLFTLMALAFHLKIPFA
ncbi:hypothetical protein XENTR_v10014892 [Xenopus tropicalis]|nr:hypothetical protein XENTR_v10014892 [Xenopus tropicalis]